jgi:protein-L-isoaspartate O-methyltransferase
MRGWIIPPPREPTKSREEFAHERAAKVRWLVRRGYLQSERIKAALLKIPREDFIPREYRDYAYLKVPFPHNSPLRDRPGHSVAPPYLSYRTD